jgi:phage baseplate assembly protein V
MRREDIIAIVAPELQRLKRHLLGIVARGFVTLVKDELKTQRLQVGVLEDEIQDDVERFQQYGFTSVPLADAEALLLSIGGGGRSHTICIVVNDPATRPTGMKPGDTAMYDNRGQTVKLTDDGITAETTKKAVVAAPEILLGSATSSIKVVKQTIAALIKAEVAKCKYVNAVGVPTYLDCSEAFPPNWELAGLSTKAKTE